MTENITINAHSSIRIAGEKILYFDPFHIQNAASDADVIFVTHDHFDHFSAEDVAKIIKDDTVFVAPASTIALIREAFSIPDERLVTLAPGDEAEVLGIPVEAVAAYNPNKPFHTFEKHWIGFVVTLNNTRYYICGDMDSTPEARSVKCDVLLVPCGGTYTMDAKEAAVFVGVLRPKIAIPTHYGDIVGEASTGHVFAQEVKKTSPETEVIVKIG